jgi:hypothetical protein
VGIENLCDSINTANAGAKSVWVIDKTSPDIGWLNGRPADN